MCSRAPQFCKFYRQGYSHGGGGGVLQLKVDRNLDFSVRKRSLTHLVGLAWLLERQETMAAVQMELRKAGAAKEVVDTQSLRLTQAALGRHNQPHVAGSECLCSQSRF